MATYHDELKAKNTVRLRELQRELPSFVKEFFRGIEDTTSARTKIGYAYDLKIFFDFLIAEIRDFQSKSIDNFTIDDLCKVTVDNIEEFLDFLGYYIKETENGSQEIQNADQGKSRKLYSVRSMFNYFYKKERIPANPTAIVASPKIMEKSKTFLDYDEVARLLDEIENGEKLTEHQKKYHKQTQIRDLAIVTLLLGTGIRISECVGLDIDHVNFDDGSFKVTRKGGNEVILFFGPEVEQSLLDYLEFRDTIEAQEDHENALFLSMQRKRITDRAVQKLVKKYSRLVTTLKNITPHKLRTTFGTNLYRETGDIYLVADILGHADINTTKRNYVDTHHDKGRQALRNVVLREESNDRKKK